MTENQTAALLNQQKSPASPASCFQELASPLPGALWDSDPQPYKLEVNELRRDPAGSQEAECRFGSVHAWDNVPQYAQGLMKIINVSVTITENASLTKHLGYFSGLLQTIFQV